MAPVIIEARTKDAEEEREQYGACDGGANGPDDGPSAD